MLFSLEEVNNENFSFYSEYDKAFETDLKQFQSRIYPSKNAVILRWYHIKIRRKYIGAIWLEKSSADNYAKLGIFIANKRYRSKGIGKKAIERVIVNDLQYFGTKKILLNVREENSRAINCYKKVGFKETRKFKKDDINVIEMIFEVKYDIQTI